MIEIIIKKVPGTPPVIGLFFPYNVNLISIVKSVQCFRYNPGLKAWTMPGALFDIDRLKAEIKDAAIIVDQRKEKNYKKLSEVESKRIGNAIESLRVYLQVMRYSPDTSRSYCAALFQFLKYFNSIDPSDLRTSDLINFFHEYIISQKRSFAYQNTFLNALKLYYREVLHIDADQIQFERPRRPFKLPNVLALKDIERMINMTLNLKHRVILSLTYSLGLRAGEVIRLKPAHIDSGRRMVRIEGGKGNKDRLIPIADSLLDLLNKYYRLHPPVNYIIEGQVPGTMYSKRSLQQVIKQAAERAGLSEMITMHWLRHSIATHMMDQGTNLRFIQEILGHSSSKTTEIYTHVSTQGLSKIHNPFDDFKLDDV